MRRSAPQRRGYSTTCPARRRLASTGGRGPGRAAGRRAVCGFAVISHPQPRRDACATIPSRAPRRTPVERATVFSLPTGPGRGHNGAGIVRTARFSHECVPMRELRHLDAGPRPRRQRRLPGVLASNRANRNTAETMGVMTGLFVCGGALASLVGLGLGMAGVFQEDRNRTFAVIGLILNGLIILGTAALFIIGMAFAGFR